jgi:hypothetical protein
MTFPAFITRFLSTAFLGASTSSCTMRYVGSEDVSSIRLAGPAWRLGGSREERISSYLPSGERASGFAVSRVESVRESHGASGNPLILTAVTLGTVPVTVPVVLDVGVTGVDRGKTDTRHYLVGMGARYSVWNNLVPKFLEDRAIARELLDAVDCNRRVR